MRNSKNYQPWSLAQAKPPPAASLQENIEHIVLCGTLAASVHNTQPWEFAIRDANIIVSIRPGQRLPMADPSGRNIFISLGCCLANIKVAAHALGYGVRRSQPEESPNQYQIQLSLVDQKLSEEHELLYKAISQRYSNKLPYNKKEIPTHILSGLAKKTGSSQLLFIQDAHKISKIAEIMEMTTAGFSRIPGFSTELARWLKPTDTEDFDGMPGFIAGFSQEESLKTRAEIAANPDYLVRLGKMDGKALRSSPVVGLVLVNDETPIEWVNAGIVYQTLCLAATVANISITPMQALIEYAPSFEEIQSIAQIVGQPAALFFRMGYADNEPYHTPRKPLRAFIK
jgi:nitroreductase